MRIFGIEVEENTPGGRLPSMLHVAVVMLPVFVFAWAIGYALIDWFELIRLTEAQARDGSRDIFRGFVGMMALAVPALIFQFRETIRDF